MNGRMQAGTWARLTALSAVHILTWSPELGLTLLVANSEVWGTRPETRDFVTTCLRPEVVRARAANMLQLLCNKVAILDYIIKTLGI